MEKLSHVPIVVIINISTYAFIYTTIELTYCPEASFSCSGL
jgi:hypothetical protein